MGVILPFSIFIIRLLIEKLDDSAIYLLGSVAEVFFYALSLLLAGR